MHCPNHDAHADGYGGGIHEPMGALGNLFYFRCADCGAVWYEPVEDVEDWVLESHAASLDHFLNKI